MFRSHSELMFFADRTLDHFLARECQQADVYPSKVQRSNNNFNNNNSDGTLIPLRVFVLSWRVLFGSHPSESTVQEALRRSTLRRNINDPNSAMPSCNNISTSPSAQEEMNSRLLTRTAVRSMMEERGKWDCIRSNGNSLSSSPSSQQQQQQRHVVSTDDCTPPAAFCHYEPHWALFDAIDTSGCGYITSKELARMENSVEEVFYRNNERRDKTENDCFSEHRERAALLDNTHQQRRDQYWDIVVKKLDGDRDGRLLSSDLRAVMQRV